MGAARAMLHDQGLPVHLWAEACNTAVYVKNRCPHRVLGMSTPEEAFTGQKPNVSHFKIFWLIYLCACDPEHQEEAGIDC